MADLIYTPRVLLECPQSLSFVFRGYIALSQKALSTENQLECHLMQISIYALVDYMAW